MRRATLKRYLAPDYAGLTNVIFHSRAENFVVNTTNSAGVVDVSGNVTKAISVLTTVHEFDSTGTAPTLTGTGVEKAIVIGAAGRLRHNGASSVWNNFHFRASINDLKWTIHAVVKFGTGSNPNNIYGLCGNYGGASTGKGIGIHYDDRIASNISDAVNFTVVRGTSNSFIIQCSNNNVIVPNQYIHLWIEVDKSKAQDEQGIMYINGKRYNVGVRIDSTIMVTTPSFAMEIGAIGNAAGPGVLEWKEITFQEGTQTDAFRRDFTMAVMSKYRIQPFAHSTDSIIRRTYFTPLIESFDDSRYYLPVVLAQNPLTPLVIVALMHDSQSHVYEAAGKISMRKSVDGGKTWGSKTTVYDPASTLAPYGVAAGYDSAGKLHVMIDVHTAVDATSTNTLEYWSSTNDGTSWASADITASLAADALGSWRVDQRIIENDSVLMTTLYKVTQEGDPTESANYVLRSTDGGANWTSITVKAKSTTYQNEASIVAVSSTVLFVVVRDEVTGEWHQYTSTNNGTSFSSQGALPLGEAFSRPSPPILCKFLINGSIAVAMYYADRDRDWLKVAYASGATLISSGLTAWILSTKTVIAQGVLDQHYHYGDCCHFNNDFNAIGMWPFDSFPASGAGTQNKILTFHIMGSQYSHIKTLLGL